MRNEEVHCSGLTKICQFEFSAVVDEQVLGLEVAMEHSSFVTVCQTTQDLEEKQLKAKQHIVCRVQWLRGRVQWLKG